MSSSPERIVITARAPLNGTLRVPGDKSVSHRALMLAGIARGTSTITGLSAGLDVKNTRTIMEALGVQIHEAADASGPSTGTLTVTGGALSEPSTVLDVGNSGTGARLLAGLCSGQDFLSIISGDASISTRPMDRVTEPLRAMGASVDGRGEGRFTPLVIRGGHLHGIDYTPPVASAQVKSAILLAGLFADGVTVVREKVPTRRHTEELLSEHGVTVKSETDDGGSSVIELHPGAVEPGSFVVPGDPSQAAFWISAAAAIPGSDVTVENLYLAPERSGFLAVLLDMGADLEIDRAVGTVRARGTELHGATVVASQMSDVIDEVPALAVAGAFAVSGTLRFEAAGELRAKESDRIETVAAAITALGGAVSTGPELLEIKAQPLGAGSIASHHDHRIAMAAAIATTGMTAGSNVEIDDWSCVATSYPGFLDQLTSLVG
ncbi:MAG: 3-phosphoshikimate 1-carboxyvinyltransferase [Actinomycetes bacterium]